MEASNNSKKQSQPIPPKVGVIIANYNYGHLLWDAVNSVVNQNYEGQLPIFIIDDASTKNRVDTKDHYYNHKRNSLSTNKVGGWTDRFNDKFNKLINEKEIESGTCGGEYWFHQMANNHGPSFCRNFMAEFAINEDCEYLAFLDADDIYHPDKIKKSVEILEKDDRIAAVYSDYSSLNMKTGVSIREYKPSYCKQLLLRECIINNDSVIRASAFQEAGGYLDTIRRAEDWDLWLRISHKHLLWHIPEDLLTVRNTGEGLSNLTEENRELWNQSWDVVRRRVDEFYKTGKIPMGSLND